MQIATESPVENLVTQPLSQPQGYMYEQKAEFILILMQRTEMERERPPNLPEKTHIMHFYYCNGKYTLHRADRSTADPPIQYEISEATECEIQEWRNIK